MEALTVWRHISEDFSFFRISQYLHVLLHRNPSGNLKTMDFNLDQSAIFSHWFQLVFGRARNLYHTNRNQTSREFGLLNFLFMKFQWKCRFYARQTLFSNLSARAAMNKKILACRIINEFSAAKYHR